MYVYLCKNHLDCWMEQHFGSSLVILASAGNFDITVIINLFPFLLSMFHLIILTDNIVCLHNLSLERNNLLYL